jgi:hypothetical protein
MLSPILTDLGATGLGVYQRIADDVVPRTMLAPVAVDEPGGTLDLFQRLADDPIPRPELEVEPPPSQPFIDSLAPVTVGSDWRTATLLAAKFIDVAALPLPVLFPQPAAVIPSTSSFLVPCGDRIPEFGDILVDGPYTLPADYPGLDDDRTIIMYDTTLVYINGGAQSGWVVLADPNVLNGFDYTLTPPGMMTGGSHTLSVHLEGVESFDVDIVFDVLADPVDVPTKVYESAYEPIVGRAHPRWPPLKGRS